MIGVYTMYRTVTLTHLSPDLEVLRRLNFSSSLTNTSTLTKDQTTSTTSVSTLLKVCEYTKGENFQLGISLSVCDPKYI